MSTTYLEKLVPYGEMALLGVFLTHIGLLDIHRSEGLPFGFEKLESRETRSDIILRLLTKRVQSCGVGQEVLFAGYFQQSLGQPTG